MRRVERKNDITGDVTVDVTVDVARVPIVTSQVLRRLLQPTHFDDGMVTDKN